MNEQIPKIIHQIWTQGCDNIPEKYHKYTQSWKSAKGYQYMCWSDESIKELLMKYDESLIPIYEYFTLPQQRSDFGRYLLLYLYGGFYIDIDIEKGNLCLDSLLEKGDFVISSGGEYANVVMIGFMGSVPNNPIFKDAIDHIRKSYKREFYEIIDMMYVERTTGGTVKNLIKDKYQDRVYKIPKDIVYHCESVDDCMINNNMIALIHFEKSWNILKYIYIYIVSYRYIMMTTLLFLIYIAVGNCSGYGMTTLCSLRKVMIVLMVLTTIYCIFSLLLNGKFCKTSVLYFTLLMVCYFSLTKKCSICKI